MSGYVHRSTLPQPQLRFGSSLREGAGGWAVPFNRVLAEIPGYGRFSSPLRKLRSFYIPPFIGRHSLSHARWACLLPQRGSRGGAVPFNGVLAKIRGWRAIFIAPTKRKGFDIVPFNRVLAKIRGCGRFSSPLRKLCFLHFSVWCPYEKSGGIFRRFFGGDYVAAAFKGRMGARVEMACL